MSNGKLGGAAQGAAIGSAFGPVGTVIGGIGGLLMGGGSNQQMTQYMPPVQTPQQQALQNLLYYGSMSNLMQQDSGFTDLLNQYIYGTPVAGAQASTGGQTATGLPTAEQAIQQYKEMQAGTREAERPIKELTRDIRAELLRPVYEVARDAALKRREVADLPDYKEAVTKAKSMLGELTNLTAKEVDQYISATAGKAIGDVIPEGDNAYRRYARKQMQSVGAISHIKEVGGALSGFGGIGGAFSKYKTMKDISFDPKISELVESEDFSNVYKAITAPVTPAEEAPATTAEEAPATTATGMPPGATTPGGGILGGIMMSPEKIAEQFRLIEEGGREDISKWYEQAAREFEQRGIGQYGGYMGSPVERDIGGILSKRGELEATLGRELGIAQSATEQRSWYDMLGALTNLQSMQSGMQAQRTSPWIGAAQNIATAPYGTSTQITTTPGVGRIPAAISGAYTGAGLANYLGNWGNQLMRPPATSYASTNIPATYGGSPSGYEGSMYGYGY